MLDNQLVVPVGPNADKSQPFPDWGGLVIGIPVDNFLNQSKILEQHQLNQKTHLVQALQNISIQGPFALSDHLLHDLVHQLNVIRTPRLLVFLFVSSQDFAVVPEPKNFFGSYSARARGSLE